MFNKTILIAAMLLTLTACSDGFDKAAENKAHQAQQKEYASVTDCQKEFKTPGDCYRGQNGHFFSPIFYPWGAIMRNGTAFYDNPVPSSGGRWVTNRAESSVNFGRSASYVSSVASSTRSSYSSSSASRGGFGSSASRASFSSSGG